VHRLFLDANILFSAAYRAEAGVGQLWRIRRVKLLTSSFAVEEARRNLPEPGQHVRLGELLKKVEVGEALMLPPERRGRVELPEKDWPILGGAVASGATHLITGDQRHFGPYFGRRILGVWIARPADYLRERA
jgi:predicted nucleic acid-binding protein